MINDITDRVEQFERNGVWGTCVDCPIKEGSTFPEKCENFSRYDHKLDINSLLRDIKLEMECMVQINV